MAPNYVNLYTALCLQLFVVVGFVVATLTISHWLGPKSKNRIKAENFESGIQQQGNARDPFSVQYFLTAILFLLFDIEVVFMYPWAIVAKEIDFEGMATMAAFLLIVFFGLFFEIKKGFFISDNK